jgi:hypothetical protein
MNRDVRKSHWCKVATRRDWLVGAFVVACLLVGSHLIWGAVQFDGEQNGESQVSASAVAASEGELARSAPPGAELFTKPIREIELGERVWAENPTGEEDLSLGVEVEPATWRRLELRAPKEDGTWAEVVLLRPEWWLEEQAELNDKDTLEVGDVVEISVPECGIEGKAEVLALGPCPQIAPGPGRVVTGTFKHSSAHILDVYVEGLDQPIGATANHPFWSEDRQEFVRSDELTTSELLRTVHGTARVVRTVARRIPEPVYNIEVLTTHTYHVGSLGVLVHNPDPCDIFARKMLRKHGGDIFDIRARNPRLQSGYKGQHNHRFNVGRDKMVRDKYYPEGIPFREWLREYMDSVGFKSVREMLEHIDIKVYP